MRRLSLWGLVVVGVLALTALCVLCGALEAQEVQPQGDAQSQAELVYGEGVTPADYAQECGEYLPEAESWWSGFFRWWARKRQKINQTLAVLG
jgi:hypothetical protein